MSWSNNPQFSWRNFEGVLSGNSFVEDVLAGHEYPGSRRRGELDDPIFTLPTNTVPYAELHCHSNFSFLDGVSHPEELAYQAAALGLNGLALTDHDGFYGVVRFANAAKKCGLATVFGAE